jgi:hypothetical protein
LGQIGRFIPTEHVSVLENPFNPQPKGEDRFTKVIDLKISKSNDYVKGKWLVVFSDGAGEFHTDKIREHIKGRHSFVAVYCISFLTADENGYSYSVTEFVSPKDNSVTFKVEINNEFTAWEVTPIME